MIKFNEQNWIECLEALSYTEQANPNGNNCFDVYDDAGIPKWQYEGWYGRERLFYFFSGIIYGRLCVSAERGST